MRPGENQEEPGGFSWLQRRRRRQPQSFSPLGGLTPTQTQIQSNREDFAIDEQLELRGYVRDATMMIASEQVRWSEAKKETEAYESHRTNKLAKELPKQFMSTKLLLNYLEQDFFQQDSFQPRTKKKKSPAKGGSTCAIQLPRRHHLPHLLALFHLIFYVTINFTNIFHGAHAYQLTNNLIANNLPPKFITSALGQASNSEIVVRVKEGPASIGKLIHTLKGDDPDDDPLTFGVLGSMASDLLRIENVPGNLANVYLRKELDRETTESYQVVITLTDGKLGRGNWVEDVNDNYPVFGPHRTAISIREDVKVPLVVETIEASDQDEGRFGQVIYRLDESMDDLPLASSAPSLSRPISSLFAIETVEGKGVISLIAPLDYEQRALYQLRVLAVDRAVEQERLTASTSILISVEDCDDQAPMFTFVPSITRIQENLPIGSPVVRVAAIDGDRGINNPIQYKLISVNGQESGAERQLFSIHPETGQVSVAGELNREASSELSPTNSPTSNSNRPISAGNSQPGSYVLQVRATELGSPLGPSVTTELTVILTDVNDELPTFNQAHYFGEILENSPPESLVTFTGAPGQSNGDSYHSQQQPVVAKVVDRDQGTNGTFTLHLEGEHAQMFDIWPREATNEANFMIKIAPSTGANLQASKLLDYERNKLFQFFVVAKEKFSSFDRLTTTTTRAQMVVHIKDANDNYPQFESELYRVEIPENAIRGMHICAVKATDADSGQYGTQGIRYTEIRGEKANKFKLDPVTGVITLKTNEHGFDRETIGQHHLIVEARDSNGSGNRNTTQLLIILTDVNDQKPKFLLEQYEAFIYENELDFQSPLQVQAVDNDASGTPNSRITYSIVSGDPQQNFTIDPQTGRIRVKSLLTLAPNLPGEEETTSIQASGGLDFERIAQKRDETRQFNLTVRATDSGLPEPLSDLTNVIVLVYDRNDHAPVFTRPVYSKSIREDAKEASQVVQVNAHDGDHSPTNSKITYRISSGASDKFVIDSDSGLITVANGANLDIDRVVGGQKRQNYLLNVVAFDGSFGPNQKSASCLVNITIIDVNNKPPEFITLGASRNSLVLQNNNNGQITATTTGSSVLKNSQQQQQMVVYVNEDAPYGLIVTRVVAFDLDSSAELRYSINYALSEARNEDMVLVEPSLVKDLFSIEPMDGTIKVAKQLDRELMDQVKLRLQVEDIGAQTPDQVAHAYLLLKITDVNDNRPTFKRPVYKAVVNENSISGTSVITVTADDRDLNKTLKYSLDGTPEMMRLVRINPKSGEVTVNDKIDRETYPMINITVKAEDYGHPHPLTGMAQLLITVSDENDNNPIFLNQSGDHRRYASSTQRHRSYGPSSMDETGRFEAITEEQHQLPLLAPGSLIKIREDAPIGHQVAYVKAEDADVSNNGRVTYLLEASTSGGKFRIDRDSGVISVAGLLDRESQPRYSLIIEACDNYDLGYSTGESRRAFTQVNVLVTDTNDNAPTISTNLQASATSLTDSSILNSSNGDTARSPLHLVHPTYEDIMSSPGPYEMPLSECLFINEFQPLNEPILTITASDADDPATPNGQIDLAIINNSAQNELFALSPVAKNSQTTTATAATTTTTTTTTSTSTSSSLVSDYTGFGAELTLSESSPSATVHSKVDHQSTDDSGRLRKRSVPLIPSDSSASIGSNFYATARSAAMRRPSPRMVGAAQPLMAPTTLVPTTNEPNLAQSATLSSVRVQSVTGDQHQQTPSGSITASANLAAEAGEQQAHLVVIQSLKERVGNYSILVRATDRNQLSSVKVINICVQDVNNHSPVFIRPPLNHTIRVMENATLGTFVTQAEATDADHGLNGELQYSLKATNIQNNNNDWQSFKIDRLTGVITTARQFNRQVKKYYTLRVQAQDFGKPTSLTSDIDINIMIVNSGQYQPEFDNQLQPVQFTENVAPGVEWVTLVATTNQDDDPALINAPTTNTDDNGGASRPWLATPCYFIVDSDDHEQVFHLDRYSHKLTNQKQIDRERKANFTLIVQATNGCNKPPIYSKSPLLESLKASSVPSTTGSSDTTTVTTTTTTWQPMAIDYRSAPDGGASDSVDVSKRSARSTRQMTTNATQVHRGKKSIEQQQSSLANQTALAMGLVGNQVEFNQAAVDALLATDKSLLKVLIRVKDVNDNAPKFTQRIYTGGITTEADFATVFMIVQALDADADNQVIYSIVKPIKRNLSSSNSKINSTNTNNSLARQKRATTVAGTSHDNNYLMTTTTEENQINDIPMNDGDDLFVINAQTGEISLNFDPQKHMKGYFEFEVMANDTDGLFDSAKVFIYLLRQDQRVKFVLRLTPQELRQRLNKFRSVFGNITGAIVNIDSYKYYENHDGTVDKKKTSLYLHFVSPEDNTIIEVDKVLTMIDNNIEYLDELYKEFHVLSSEAAYLPLSSSALIDPIDQIRTGLLGVSSFLALILVLVIGLCLNQRTRYERQLKAATVSAFGSSPLHLEPDYHSQTNLPNTNLHSQDPNPIWMQGYGEHDWLAGGQVNGKALGAAVAADRSQQQQLHNHHPQHQMSHPIGIEDADYLSSGQSDLNSLSGVNSVSQLHYNATTTATPRDSLSSSQGHESGSGSGSTSTTNERQALCKTITPAVATTAVATTTTTGSTDRRNPQQQQQQQQVPQLTSSSGQLQQRQVENEVVVGVLKNGKPMVADTKRRGGQHDTISHSTFGAYKEVTIYTDPSHNQQQPQQGSSQFAPKQFNINSNNNSTQTSQVNKIASQFNAKQQSRNQVYISHQQQLSPSRPTITNQQRILVHANGADVNQGIIKHQIIGSPTKTQKIIVGGHQQTPKPVAPMVKSKSSFIVAACGNQFSPTNNTSPMEQQQQQVDHQSSADNFESNLSKLSILNLETTEL